MKHITALAQPETERSSVRAVERALQLIEVFARWRGPLSVSELSAELNLAPSTVHRLVQTLMGLGYVMQYPQSKRYGVGRGIAEISRAMLLKYGFSQHAQPHLEALAQASGETTNLAVLYGTSAIYLNQFESPAMVRVSNPIGTLIPLHATAVGKMFLSDFRPAMLGDVIGHTHLTRYTGHTLTTPQALDRELQQIRKQGYAVDEEEFAEGVCCVAAGLRGSSGAVVATLSISGPSSRVRRERIGELAQMVIQTAEGFAAQIREP